MILNSENIYDKLRYIGCTGNAVEEIITYSVKSRQVSLFVEKYPSGVDRYRVKFLDWQSGETSETQILFEAYPKEQISHSAFIGNNENRIYYSNSGIQKNFREILRAIGKLHRLPICGRNDI
jgi:hypothetical protein